MQNHSILEQRTHVFVGSGNANPSSLVQFVDDRHFDHLWAVASLPFESLFQEKEIDLSRQSTRRYHCVFDVLSLNIGSHGTIPLIPY